MGTCVSVRCTAVVRTETSPPLRRPSTREWSTQQQWAGRVLPALVPSGWSVENVVTMEVVQSTRVVVLNRLPSIACVHTQPCAHRWVPQPVLESGFLPQQHSSTGCGYVWQTDPHKGVLPGEYQFVSRFTVVSASRCISPKLLQCSWDAVEHAKRSYHPDEVTISSPDHLPLSVCRAAQFLREQCAPAAALRRAVEWVLHAIDSGMAGPLEEPIAEAALLPSVESNRSRSRSRSGSQRGGVSNNGRTGSGEQAARTLAALCQAMGFGVRAIVGLDVSAAGNGEEFKQCATRAWVEVLFPRVGWTEVNPNDVDEPLALPCTLIKCRGPWRAYSVLVPAGAQRQAERNGKHQLVRAVTTVTARLRSAGVEAAS